MTRKMRLVRVFILALAVVALFSGTSRAGWDPGDEDNARHTIENFRKKDPSLERFFSKAYGYAVFSDIYKGGFMILGGARGKGFVYEKGLFVGRSTVTQLNLGPQLGAQSFAEIIFFKGKEDLDNFRKGNFELNAQVAAVVVTTGMATNTDYSNGVAVFAMPNAGVMAEVSLGGQKFSFEPDEPAR